MRKAMAVGALFLVLATNGCADDDRHAEVAAAEAKMIREQQAEDARDKRRELESRALDRKQAEDREERQLERDNDRERKITGQHSSQCAATRSDRAASAKTDALNWTIWLQRVAPHEDQVRKQCVARDTTGTHVERTPDATGVTVRLRSIGRTDDVSCNGSLPKGITKEDARFLIWNVTPEAFALPLSESNDEIEDCRKDDLAAGLDTQVAAGDMDGLKALIQWKPPASDQN